MHYEPLVTILIPVYNGEKFVRDAIDSALAQTYKNIEILVINDGSTDATESVLASYSDKIRYITKENGGVSTALNMGIANMRGEWLSWLSHDDRYLPDKVQHQVDRLNELQKDESLDIHKIILYCDNERIDVNGNFISRKRHTVSEDETIVDSMLNNIRNYNICGCAVLIPKAAFDVVGGFKVEIPTVSDADMWYRMMFAGYRFVHMREVLVQSRQHQGQVSKRKQEQCDREQNAVHVEIATKMLEILEKEEQVWLLGCYLVQRGFEDAAKVVFDRYQERFNKKFGLREQLSISRYRIKHRGRNVLRSVYRKLTSK